MTRVYWKTLWHDLTTSQRLYLATLSLLLIEIFTEESFSLKYIIIPLALIALVQEFWPYVMRFWETLIGKAFILLFYALIANFALVNASGRINELTGVSAISLPYTHNFSIIMLLPVWIFIASIAILTVLQVILLFYILLLVPLKLFRVKLFWHTPNYRAPLFTAIVRFVSCILIWSFILMSTQQSGVTSEVLRVFEGSEIAQKLNLAIEQENNLQDTKQEQMLSEQDKTNYKETDIAGLISPQTTFNPPVQSFGLTVTNPLLNNDDGFPKLAFELTESVASSNEETQLDTQPENIRTLEINASGQFNHDGWQYDEFLTNALSYFIYYFEADERSRCEHPEDSRVIELNTYEILTILPDDNEESGYLYEVKACISPAIGHHLSQFKK